MRDADQSCVCGAVPTGGNDQKQITQGHLRVSVLEEIRPSRMWPPVPRPCRISPGMGACMGPESRAEPCGKDTGRLLSVR